MNLLEHLNAALSDRYRIERQLGGGGMALVFLARDLKHHRYVALKALRPELTASLASRRFLREIRITAKLSHPHVLPLYDSGEAGFQLYYVMPYVDGESLAERRAREERLAIEEAIRLATEVADALAYAHSLGVVHRDVKPQNIMLSRGHAVVGDFGIARAVKEAGGEKLTETGAIVGTPAYMSPEQADGGELDGRADVYSLGCVLYEMVVGRAPFSGQTPQAILSQHSNEPVPNPRTIRTGVSKRLERVILRALAKSPRHRFETATEFGEALRHCV